MCTPYVHALCARSMCTLYVHALCARPSHKHTGYCHRVSEAPAATFCRRVYCVYYCCHCKTHDILRCIKDWCRKSVCCAFVSWEDRLFSKHIVMMLLLFRWITDVIISVGTSLSSYDYSAFCNRRNGSLCLSCK